MEKPKSERTVIAIRFTPGEEFQTQVTGTGEILKDFKDHCKRKKFQYSKKVIELCQKALKSHATGEELKTLVIETGVGLTGLRIGPFIKVIITQYMNGLKPEAK